MINPIWNCTADIKKTLANSSIGYFILFIEWNSAIHCVHEMQRI